MWPKTTTYLRIWPNYGWPNRCAKSPIHWSIGSRRNARRPGKEFLCPPAPPPANAARRSPRLGDDAASQTRLLIDDVLDTLE